MGVSKNRGNPKSSMRLLHLQQGLHLLPLQLKVLLLQKELLHLVEKLILLPLQQNLQLLHLRRHLPLQQNLRLQLLHLRLQLLHLRLHLLPLFKLQKTNLEEVPSFYLDKAAVRHKLLSLKLQETRVETLLFLPRVLEEVPLLLRQSSCEAQTPVIQA